MGSGGTLLFDVALITQSYLYRGRKPLDPPLSSASGYLPPRSVGVSMSGSFHGGEVMSRSSTMRRRGTGDGGPSGGGTLTSASSSSRMPSMKTSLVRLKDAALAGARTSSPRDASERAPLLPVVESTGSEGVFGTSSRADAEPRYRSTSS